MNGRQYRHRSRVLRETAEAFKGDGTIIRVRLNDPEHAGGRLTIPRETVRILLRHDTVVGCFMTRHVIPGVVAGIHDWDDGTGPWCLVRLDEFLSDATWRSGEVAGPIWCRRRLLIRSMWKGFDIGGRWPTKVEVLTAVWPASGPGGITTPARGVLLAKCYCFLASSLPQYERHLRGSWHRARPTDCLGYDF